MKGELFKSSMTKARLACANCYGTVIFINNHLLKLFYTESPCPIGDYFDVALAAHVNVLVSCPVVIVMQNLAYLK